MTEESIQKINERVARKLGWTKGEESGIWFLDMETKPFQTIDIRTANNLPNYAERIEDAWELVEYLKAPWFFGLKTWGRMNIKDGSASRTFEATFAKSTQGLLGIGETAPLAICRAFLALEAE